MLNKSKCIEHIKQNNRDYNANRRKISPDVYNWTWRKKRVAFLRNNPLCVKCKEHGQTQIATEVDNIIPHGGNMEIFWNQDNWQSLCKSCHSKKTIKEWQK
jgi:5-methylcytosine-specific restriction protein A